MSASHAAPVYRALEKRGGAEVVYLAICQGCRAEGLPLSFEREFVAMYSRGYPVSIKAFVALAVRLAIGEHVVRLEAVHAAFGAKHTVTDTKIVSLSSFGIWRPHGEVPLRFSEPGPHFVNVRVDGQRIAAMLGVRRDLLGRLTKSKTERLCKACRRRRTGEASAADEGGV